MTDIDGNNQKALYLHGKSNLKMRRFEEAINSFKKLVLLAPDNADFNDSLKEAQSLSDQDLKKQKSVFKKMIFSNND